EIRSNYALTNLDGLSSLAVVRGGLRISSNPALTNVDGLSSLTSVGELGAASQSAGTLQISYNAVLTNLDGLSGLTSSSLVAIISNPMLTNLDGLSGLTSRIGFAAVYITDNAALAGFCGLYPLLNSSGGVGSYYVVGNLDNPTIEDILAGGPCNANPAQLIADLLAAGTLNQGQANALNAKLNNCNLNAFNNQINGWVNAGILTQQQADNLNAAATQHCSPASRIADQQVLTLGQNYPNPARTHTVIPFTLTTSGKVSIQLYDTAGKMIRSVINEYLLEGTHEVKVNLQSIPAGTYFYKLQVGEQIETLPMVVE
ncbi:MAG: T9SS type A sorting domain-containing protein, partial [Bacteroidetes bacterium]|nr:T9SS type A sorting domain-containing protein [Bacteroidota bacterium]